MVMSAIAGSALLPETFAFLNLGWWIIHILGIPAVFIVGYGLACRKARKKESAGPAEAPEG